MSMIDVYVCNCGLNIAGLFDVERVVGYDKNLADVEIAKHYTCLNCRYLSFIGFV